MWAIYFIIIVVYVVIVTAGERGGKKGLCVAVAGATADDILNQLCV